MQKYQVQLSHQLSGWNRNITVFKTNGRPVAPGDQKLGWTSWIWHWASKDYDRLHKDGNFLNTSGRLSENFSLKHWYYRTTRSIVKTTSVDDLAPCVTKSSATCILTMLHEQNPIFNQKALQILALSQCRETTTKNTNYIPNGSSKKFSTKVILDPSTCYCTI